MQQLTEFATTNPILVTVFLVLLFLFLRTFVSSGAAKSIGNMEAVRLMNNEAAFVLDVRTTEEYQQGHIASAVNIPVGLLDARISDIQNNKSQSVILVCQSGNRSNQAARVLKKHGFEKLFNLSAGMSGWSQSNLPVISGSKAGGSKDKEADSKHNKKKRHRGEDKNTYISRSNPGESSEVMEPVESEEEKIIVYTSGHCPFNGKVKKLLSEKGIDFQQVNLVSDPGMRDLIADKAGQTTFPQVFRGEIHIGNCDELYQMEKEGKLNGVLGLKGA